jgi:translocation and assembly module TamB
LIRISYLLVYYLLILFVLLTTTVVVIASHPETARYLADKLLKENGIDYSSIEGSLLEGAILHDVNYNDAVLITHLEVKYNIFMLFNPTPTLKKIKLEGTSIILDKLPHNEKSEEALTIPAFAVSQLQLRDTQILANSETFSFDLDASKIHYRRELNVKRLTLQLRTSYGDANIKGNIRSNRLYAKSSVTPQASLIQEYLNALHGIPKTLSLGLEAGVEDVVIHTRFDHIDLNNTNASLHDADIMLSYRIPEEYFTFNSRYGLSYDKLRTEVKHKGTFTTRGVYTSELNATLIQSPFVLPFESFSSKVSGDKEGMLGSLNAGPLQFEFETQAYKRFSIQAKSEGLALSFIPDLPELLKKNSIAFKADALLDTDPFRIKGTFDAEGSHCTFKGRFEVDKDQQLYLTTLTPKPESTLWEGYPIKLFSPLDFVYYNDYKRDIVNLDANMLNLTLFKTDYDVNGWGNVGSGNFGMHGKIVDVNDTRLSVTADIPSIHRLMSEFGFTTPDDALFLDAQADINATVALTDKVTVKSRVHLPWYIIKPDTQTSYQGEDVYLESTLVDEQITIDRYSLNVKDHHIYSQRPSRIAFDANGSLLFKEFWIYDNLLLSGTLDPARMQGNLRLQSERFNYESKEGNITLKADIKADLNRDGQQNIEGEITLLEGVITYEPKTDYSISDDVIIIQDIRPRSKFKRFVNIHINSLKPIRYKTKDVDIRFTPDIILWQEPNTPLGIYGMVTIEDGQVIGGGKLFELDKSEIYFNGSDPINPYLNLNIRHQTLDNMDIQIYITNTLSSPVVILASNPVMSQNDIMSYLLFGEPASSAFSSSGEGSKTFAVSSLLLATGLKQMFNDSAGVNIDTLNILTNEEGTLGYEIGTRFSKDIRVVYRNDTVSSVILQYSLSRSIRLDIDVHETGQGVSILYVKDF